MTGIKIITKNKKARYRYEILDNFEAGIVLVGTEVKSLRNGRIHMDDSYAYLKDEELFWINANIPLYEFGGTAFNHDPLRTRKLLVKKSEIRRLNGYVHEKGLSLIPLKAYWRKGRVKIDLGIARGKNIVDKRRTQKDRDWNRQKQRLLKNS
ncbi:SsrA-binding protein SmpB [Magnetococcales bacterium HHB-1]